jgi:hypothetical protein
MKIIFCSGWNGKAINQYVTEHFYTHGSQLCDRFVTFHILQVVPHFSRFKVCVHATGGVFGRRSVDDPEGQRVF